MNFELSSEQAALREAFARFLDTESSTVRVRGALPSGFDPALWKGLAEFGAFSVRVPEAEGGLGLGLLDAAVQMEEAGRTLVSGPIVEAVVAIRLLALAGGEVARTLLAAALEGRAVVTFAFFDLKEQPTQWVAGGAVAEAVIAREGDRIVLVANPEAEQRAEPNLASTPIAELNLADAHRTVLAVGPEALSLFQQAIEEWKLLMASALSGLAREAVRLASEYAAERVQFGRPIGTYQAISHPLADLITEVEGGRFLIWKALLDIADGSPRSGAEVSLALWWNADVAARAVSQSLQTFGGYGLTTDYDIHLYNLRAKSWPLTYGDPSRWLDEAGRRLYGGELSTPPDVGQVELDFGLGDEARAFAAEVEDFFNRTLTPELRSKAHFSWDGHDPYVHRKLAEERLLFPSWPREYGGREAPPYAVAAAGAVFEDHGWTTHASGTTQMIASIIRMFGSDELKRDVLTKTVAGEALCSLGYSEPGSGSDVFAAQCRATRDRDGWRIDGQKMFTSGANLAQYVLLLTRTDPEAPKHLGLTMFVVPLDAPGIEIQPVYTFQDERTNITYYDGVKVPDSYRLGEVNGGLKVMSAALGKEQGASFAKVQGHMLRAAEEACHQLCYNGRPLIEDPQAQARLARTYANVQVADLLWLRALWASGSANANVAYGPMSKMFSSERFLSDAQDLLNLTSPASLSKREGPLAFLNLSYRHAHATRIYGGTSQVHRSLIAERFLKLPRSRT